MTTENLFKLIRQNQICLWIGSGFSLYAGMPSVANIKDLLIDSLKPAEKPYINPNDSLQRITRDFQILKGREHMISLLKVHFNVLPVDTHLHDLLARISHFRSIITTNYDKLIEQSYTRKLGVMVSDEDVFLAAQAPHKLYKVHGDIDRPDSIVLTEDDYNKHYNRDFKTPFLASVISEIAGKHMIFLGYGYEDGNILADFEKIEEKSDFSDRKKILVCPAITNPIQKKRILDLGIEHFEMTGEVFLTGLIEDIKKNLLADHAEGLVDSQVAQDFATAFDMKVSINASSKDEQHMTLEKANGPSTYNLVLTTKHEGLKAKLKDFDSFDPIEIQRDQLESFLLAVEGFHILTQETLAHFTLEPVPTSTGKFSIEFPEQDYELENIRFQFFAGNGKIRVIAEIYDYRLQIDAQLSDGRIPMNFKINGGKEGNSSKRLVKVFKVLHLLFSGAEFRILVEKGGSYNWKFDAQDVSAEFHEYYEFFKDLNDIEKYFKVDFGLLGTGDYKQEVINNVRKLTSLIKNKYYANRDPEGLDIVRMPPTPRVYEFLENEMVEDAYLYLSADTDVIINLFGVQLHLGREQICLLQPSLVKSDRSNRTATLLAKDHVNIFYYGRFGLHKAKGAVTVWSAKDYTED
ncbi:SIR2 family protein [Pedobacter aquatilis]|uniref:SIR2 family protein n=1 Tax=Pedobacter aquatilis TaxID=351343 RepID=UPI0025B2E75A|nr:SIR2 family protein [Pedobacter aquatilis]MDN3588058.1 SIR2 family protein [Pedobacter aquatilis]